MVKAEVKTPNKRKSIANNTPKIKVEKASPVKKAKLEPDTLVKKTKSENGQTVVKENVVSPKIKKQQGKPTNGAAPKPFKGTKQLNKTKPGDGVEKKKRRKSQFAGLMAEVKSKSGSKDSEVLAKLNQRIKDIKARGELTKTAKKKLSILNKMKLIVEEGGDVAAAKSKIQRQKDIEEARKAREAKKALKTTEGTQVSAGKKSTVQAKQAPKQQQTKKVVQPEDSDEEEDDDDEEEEDSDELEEEEDDEEEEEEDEEDEESEEEAPAPKQTEKKGQKRFVVFVGNIPYDTTKQDLCGHFSKVGNIVHVRIPTEKGSNRPRGFAYVEVDCETSYQKCLSMHHSHLKGRRINVLYTQGGKKKGEEKKKEIKAKNFKLHALRQRGKLAGSTKMSQKRSFRRNKGKTNPPPEQN